MFGAALAICLVATPAQAPQCRLHGEMLAWLEASHAERVAHRGVTSKGALLEVTVDPETGKYTIVLTSPRGLSCIVSYGTGWRDVAAEQDDPET